MTEAPASGRRRRRETRGTATHAAPPAPAYLTRQMPPLRMVSDAQLDAITDQTRRLLDEVGIDFREDEEVLEIWRTAGARVDGERVRFPDGLLQEALKTAPATFTHHARNPARSTVIGGNNTVFAPVYGPPFVQDLEGGRRYGTIADFQNFVKLIYQSPGLHSSGGTVCEPVDIPVNKRHLDMIYAHLRHSDKNVMGSVTAPERAEDSVAMMRIVFGEEFVDNNCVLVSLINANSPLVFDDTMLGALKVYARANQACIVSPFILAGAMSPVTPAATLSQVLAEGMAGCALTQLLRPGAPVIFGTFVATLSMQSGAPVMGMPESSLMLNGAAELARRLNLPFRSGGSLCTSKIPDAQAAYESANTITSTYHSGVNFALHAAGWLEGGLVSGYEKLLMDAEQLHAMSVLAKGVAVDENGLGYKAFEEMGVGKHFLGAEHTQENYKTAFFSAQLSDYRPFEHWSEDGSKDIVQRAHVKWQQMLEQHVDPEIDPALDAALLEFIAARKDSMPDRWTS